MQTVWKAVETRFPASSETDTELPSCGTMKTLTIDRLQSIANNDKRVIFFVSC